MLSNYPKNTVSYKGKSFEEWADYYRYEVGLNVISAQTKFKDTKTKWKEWQDKPIPEELHKQWKNQGDFRRGMAIMPGKVWHNKRKNGLVYVGIDLDTKNAIDEFCKINGVTKLSELSEKFIIEQHKDDFNRAHVGFYSKITFKDKGSDDKIGIEIKSNNKGILFCCPSIHKNGYPYEILGTLEPITLSKVEAEKCMIDIDSICSKYGVHYLDKHQRHNCDNSSIDFKIKRMINAFKVDLTIDINEGIRHNTLLSLANKLLFKYKNRYKQDEIQSFVLQINQKCCKPEPLPDEEIEQIWFDALEYVKNNHNEDGLSISNTIHELSEFDQIYENVNSILNKNVQFFKDQYGKKFAKLELNDHFEILNIKSNSFKDRITYLINEKMKHYMQTKEEV